MLPPDNSHRKQRKRSLPPKPLLEKLRATSPELAPSPRRRSQRMHPTAFPYRGALWNYILSGACQQKKVKSKFQNLSRRSCQSLPRTASSAFPGPTSPFKVLHATPSPRMPGGPGYFSALGTLTQGLPPKSSREAPAAKEPLRTSAAARARLHTHQRTPTPTLPATPIHAHPPTHSVPAKFVPGPQVAAAASPHLWRRGRPG